MSLSRFFSVNGLALRCAQDGPEGQDPLVFIHSLGSDLDLWAQVAAAFAPRHHVILYDLRGHGLSDCGPAECTIEDHVSDLFGLLDQLGLSMVTLLGDSVGGQIALRAAYQHRDRVRRQVLCGTGAKIGTTESWNERIATVRIKGLDVIADGVVGRWFSTSFKDREAAIVRGWRNRLVRTPAEGYAATCAALRDSDLRPALANIKTPSLVITGEEDVATPLGLGRELAAGLTNAHFVLQPGAAHLPPVDQPAAVTGHIIGLLQEFP